MALYTVHIILERINGKCRKLSNKNLYTFAKTCCLGVDTGKYLNNSAIIDVTMRLKLTKIVLFFFHK